MHAHPFRLLGAALIALSSLAAPASAAGLIRDADIEHALGELARPILNAAGLSPAQTRIRVVDSESLNAFVLDGRHIFIHAGLILKLETAAQLQAVIAHEAAHIANGHITRRMTNVRNTRSAAGFGMLLAAAVAAAGGGAEAAGGLAAGAAGAAQRNFLAHSRAEEAAADQSGIRYMHRSGVDPNGAVEVLEIFRGQEALSVGRQDPYVQSHPLTRERLRAMRGFVAATGAASGQAPGEGWFARAQGKLSAFRRAPRWTLRRVGTANDPVSAMRRAVAHHRTPDARRAISEMQALLKRHPNDPFLHELMGQILLESRQTEAAVRAYDRAVALAPGHPLILAGQGRALLALDTAAANRRALAALENARARDGEDARTLRDLALAHARNGQTGLAALATAERFALSGRIEDAGLHARRAAGLLAQGSGPWQRAQDVIRAAETVKRR